MADLISIPRAVLEQLVDPEEQPYVVRLGDRGFDYCAYCLADIDFGEPHDPACPVRLAQEALRQTSS